MCTKRSGEDKSNTEWSLGNGSLVDMWRDIDQSNAFLDAGSTLFLGLLAPSFDKAEATAQTLLPISGNLQFIIRLRRLLFFFFFDFLLSSLFEE